MFDLSLFELVSSCGILPKWLKSTSSKILQEHRVTCHPKRFIKGHLLTALTLFTLHTTPSLSYTDTEIISTIEIARPIPLTETKSFFTAAENYLKRRVPSWNHRGPSFVDSSDADLRRTAGDLILWGKLIQDFGLSLYREGEINDDHFDGVIRNMRALNSKIEDQPGFTRPSSHLSYLTGLFFYRYKFPHSFTGGIRRRYGRHLHQAWDYFEKAQSKKGTSVAPRIWMAIMLVYKEYVPRAYLSSYRNNRNETKVALYKLAHEYLNPTDRGPITRGPRSTPDTTAEAIVLKDYFAYSSKMKSLKRDCKEKLRQLETDLENERSYGSDSSPSDENGPLPPPPSEGPDDDDEDGSDSSPSDDDGPLPPPPLLESTDHEEESEGEELDGDRHTRARVENEDAEDMGSTESRGEKRSQPVEDGEYDPEQRPTKRIDNGGRHKELTKSTIGKRWTKDMETHLRVELASVEGTDDLYGQLAQSLTQKYGQTFSIQSVRRKMRNMGLGFSWSEESEAFFRTEFQKLEGCEGLYGSLSQILLERYKRPLLKSALSLKAKEMGLTFLWTEDREEFFRTEFMRLEKKGKLPNRSLHKRLADIMAERYSRPFSTTSTAIKTREMQLTRTKRGWSSSRKNRHSLQATKKARRLLSEEGQASPQATNEHSKKGHWTPEETLTLLKMRTSEDPKMRESEAIAARLSFNLSRIKSRLTKLRADAKRRGDVNTSPYRYIPDDLWGKFIGGIATNPWAEKDVLTALRMRTSKNPEERKSASIIKVLSDRKPQAVRGLFTKLRNMSRQTGDIYEPPYEYIPVDLWTEFIGSTERVRWSQEELEQLIRFVATTKTYYEKGNTNRTRSSVQTMVALLHDGGKPENIDTDTWKKFCDVVRQKKKMGKGYVEDIDIPLLIRTVAAGNKTQGKIAEEMGVPPMSIYHAISRLRKGECPEEINPETWRRFCKRHR